jgi:hypothetical protein
VVSSNQGTLNSKIKAPAPTLIKQQNELLKKKFSLVFLSQGLRSDEIAKMRALFGRLGVSLRMVPLRL